MKAVVIGGSSWDTLIHVDELNSIKEDMSLWANNVVETVGGTGAGKALCLDALGNEVTLFTDVGNDEIGKKILTYFNSTNIKVIPLMVDKTTTHTNIMHSNGKRISIFTSVPSINPNIPYSHLNQIDESDMVFLNINNFCRDFIPYLKNLNKLVVVDIHDYDPPNPYHNDFIEIADIIIASGVNIPNHQKFLKDMIIKGKQIAVITKGSSGLIAMSANGVEYSLKGYKGLQYVDSNGAGDSFTSGLMSYYLKSGNIRESLKYATVCGAIACTSYELFNRNYDWEKILEIKKEAEL